MTDSNDAGETSGVAKSLSPAFGEALNRHGYSFHYAVVAKFQSLHESQRSRWRFEACEFPIEVAGKDSRIDFILSQKGSQNLHPQSGAPSTPEKFLLAECKRANPSFSHWCFAKAPYVSRSSHSDDDIVESVSKVGESLVAQGIRLRYDSSDAYHIPLELKTDIKGDPVGKPRGAIDEALFQVSKMISGFAAHLQTAPATTRYGESRWNVLIPVVFTTATLYVTDTDLSKADISNGEIDANKLRAEERAFVKLQYPVSRGLKHNIPLPAASEPRDLTEFLNRYFLRTVFIVNGARIADFMCRIASDGFDYERVG